MSEPERHDPINAAEWLRWSKLWDERGRDPRFLEDPKEYVAGIRETARAEEHRP